MTKYKLCWDSPNSKTGEIDIPSSAKIVGFMSPPVFGESDRMRTVTATIGYLMEDR